ncbi:hypothetical protein ACIHEJ_24955 [Streptomyces sp. NPDC052301]|uniref:hypothetical protein n=1 Tax=Streptomyces sp. NPDC052301 TaxID=3365687 RepID=UPI0037D2EA4A
MSAQHSKRLFAVSAVGVLLAGGAAVGAAGTASAATTAHVTSYYPHSSRGCDEVWGNGGCDTYDDQGWFDQGGDRGDGYGDYCLVLLGRTSSRLSTTITDGACEGVGT